MKKSIFIALLGIATMFSVQSCREDGGWEDVQVASQYGFTIDRDREFIEKGVGEKNFLKFNINAAYEFSTISTYIKFTTSDEGVLSLNGEELEANKEYQLKTFQNVLEYTGKVSGRHKVKVYVRNDKGVSVSEEFELAYGITDFTLSLTYPTNQIYQGNLGIYNLKINGKPIEHQIRFDQYDGEEILLNGEPAQKGVFYTIPANKLGDIRISLKSSVAGQNKLIYTIKNATVMREQNEIVQNILPRKIEVLNLTASSDNIDINDQLRIVGVLEKLPTSENKTIYYRTWLSKGNSNGFTTTQGQWTSYDLTSPNFLATSTAKVAGDYEYSIQFKDEFGNTTETKTFDVVVNEPLRIVGEVKVNGVEREIDHPVYNSWYVFEGGSINFRAESSPSNKIIRFEYEITYSPNGEQPRTIRGEKNYSTPQQEINVNETFRANHYFERVKQTKVSYKLKIISYTGKIIEREGEGAVSSFPF